MSSAKKRGRGRPLGSGMNIELRQVTELAGIGCTEAEIAAVLGVTHRTLTRWKSGSKSFAEALAEGREEGRATLRRMQWNGAKAGNATMLIWLGKQLLGQTDKVSSHVVVSEGPTLMTTEQIMESYRDAAAKANVIQ